MIASDVVNAYLAARRAQGVRLRSGARVLHQFVREIGNPELSEVTPESVDGFLRGRGQLSATWKTKRAVLVGLYRFAIARAYTAVSPLPEQTPRLSPPQTPYVYTPDELRRLVAATAALSNPCSRLQAATYRTLLLILYGAGLRVSEAIGLQLGDVDLEHESSPFTIRSSTRRDWCRLGHG